MMARTFTTKGIQRPVDASTSVVPFQVAAIGNLSFEETSLAFNEWRIPYRTIKSAILQTQYALGFPRHYLLLTDGANNYLFHIPQKESGMALPFEVVREGKQSLWRRFWWLILVAVSIAVKVYK
jgi:hypothetical protein